MLTERYANRLEEILLPMGQVLPFGPQPFSPQDLPGQVREFAIKRAEAYLNTSWPSLPAALYMDFARTGTRNRYEQPYMTRRRMLKDLAVAEWLEGKGRFTDDLINGIWCICEETSWILPAHKYLTRTKKEPVADISEPVIDLFAGETGALLAWVLHLLEGPLAAVSPLIAARIRHELQERIIGPYLARHDFWWMLEEQAEQINNWAPWCTSNCLAVALLHEPEPARRAEAVRKAMQTLDVYLEHHPRDGGCDEGSGYWFRAGGSLLDALEHLYAASGGQIHVYDQPLIQEIGTFMQKAYIAGDYFVNFADGPARSQGASVCLYHYGRRIGASGLAALGQHFHRLSVEQGQLLDGGVIFRELLELACYEELLQTEEAQLRDIYLRDAWLPDLQVMTARETAGDWRGLYVAAKGGHNNENHNHNDVGQFLIYAGGKPLVVDPGVGVYTAQTFSDRRYDIWTMQSSYHNLPEINGCQQQAGRQYEARDCHCQAEAGQASFALELAGAYPREAGLKEWRRTITLRRERHPGTVTVEEKVALTEETAAIRLHWITACLPVAADDGSIRLIDNSRELARLAVDGPPLDWRVEKLELNDERLRGIWGDCLYRLIWQPRQKLASAVWRFSLQCPEGTA